MSVAVTFLEEGRQTPEDIAALLAEFVAAAQSTLHLAIYDFRLSEPLADQVGDALRRRIQAGVEIRIAFDAGKKTTPFVHAGADPAPPGTADFIQRLDPGIASEPITGGGFRLPRLMHHKYLVRDGGTPAAAVWTGSTNFSDDAWALQENNIVRIESPELARYYEFDFEELWKTGDIGTSGIQDTGTAHIGGRTVRVAFAPGQGRVIDHEIAHAIATARYRLRVGSMLVTSGAILGALGDCLQRGQVADYGCIYDRTQMESVFDQWRGTPAAWKIAAFAHVATGLAGKRSTPYAPGSRHDSMHNKALVVDDTVITGSFNLSHSATENAENILFIHDPALADEYTAYLDRLAARYGGGSDVPAAPPAP